MSFLNKLISGAYGQLVAQKPAPSRNADPVGRARDNFVTQAQKQMASLQAGDMNKKGSWVQRQQDDSCKVCLRNGTNTIKLADNMTHVVRQDAISATVFLAEAIAACKAGELDQLLAASARVSKKAVQA